MGDKSGFRERGFTLIELVIAVAVVATTVAAGVGLSLASRSFAVAAAATEFDHVLDSARTIARQLQGATLAFVPDAYGDGTEVRVLAGGSGTLTPTTLPPLHTRAVIEELEALHQAPFAFVVHVNGALGGRPGFRISDTNAGAEVGCPASGAFHFVIHAAGGSADRYVPCRITLASTGPVTFVTWSPAPAVASPTPCGGPCAPPTLPAIPSSSPSCPPNYATTSGGCTPTPPPNPGPRYHVTATLASPTMTIGGTDTFTAQATLTNPTGVPAGTPPTIPVAIQQPTSGICTVSPPGSQLSGATFILAGTSPGTCAVVVQAELSGIPGATADSASVSVSVADFQSPTPTPRPCDLVANGKCYHRIVDATNQGFTKYVAPDVNCDSNAPDNCRYVDAIRDIQLSQPYIIQTTIPPSDMDHELLISIDKITTVYSDCLPYQVIANIPANMPITWSQNSAGAPVDAPTGFGEPSRYLTENHMISPSGPPLVVPFSWQQGTNLLGMFEAVATKQVGSSYVFTYHATDIGPGFLQWYPDFPGCETAGDQISGNEYGIAMVYFTFEVFQATP